ncbi:hypothetical protein EPUL_005584, partial [Erysiphe pulchra]
MAETYPTIQSTEFLPWTEVQVNNATASDITDYINERIHEYEDENLYGSELHGYFVADFHKFTVKTFKKTTESSKNLMDFLRMRNVFIQKSRGQSIPAALIDALLDQWCSMPDEMINEVLQKYRPILQTSRNLKALPNNHTSSHNPVIILMKAYTEEQKYTGTPSESLDLKYKIFTGLYAALQHYHTTFNSENLPDLSTLYQTIKSNFEGKEYQQSMLVKWNEMSLKTTLKDIESSDVEIALNTLITNLRQIQMSLSPEFQSDKFLFAKILQACRAHPSCSIACSTVMDDTVATLTNRLRFNIATWKSQQNLAIEHNPRFVAETHFDESTIDAFIHHYEGIDPDEDRSLVHAFDTFLTIKQDFDSKTPYIPDQFFHTQCGMLDFTLAQNTAQQINTGIT